MLQWQVVNLISFLPLAIGAIALLSSISGFSFGSFARHYAGKLTVAFLALNALLLIPVREAVYVSVLAAIALFVAIHITLNTVRHQRLLMTHEAKYALACFFIPGIIIVTRALGLYAVDNIVLLTRVLRFAMEGLNTSRLIAVIGTAVVSLSLIASA